MMNHTDRIDIILRHIDKLRENGFKVFNFCDSFKFKIGEVGISFVTEE